jgi:catechol 2,3-dioxygenase-like lactoylglutathione lyase family enzyme
MRSRLDLLTLVVPELDAARQFYLDGLGWTAALDVPGEVLFLQLNHGLLVGLLEAQTLADDLGEATRAIAPGSGFTLAHNTDGPAAVRDELEKARLAGATIIKSPQDAAFGGYHGYFADPSGILWEVSHNPGWHVDSDGQVTIDVIE